MALEGNATSYDRVSDPQVQQALKALARIQPEGIHVVLDAGCGTGRVTELLLQRLPDARVVALDASRQMRAEAARRLRPAVAAGRVQLVHADLAQPIPLAEPVDAIVSTATFHWLTDHDALFRNLAAVLRPGGQLVAQCGGAGNIAGVLAALRAAGEAWEGPWYFATPEETRRRLLASGFVDVETWLHHEPARLEPGAPHEEYQTPDTRCQTPDEEDVWRLASGVWRLGMTAGGRTASVRPRRRRAPIAGRRRRPTERRRPARRRGPTLEHEP